MKKDTIYLSAGINQTNKCLDWNGDKNLVAYAASNHIVLYDMFLHKVTGVSYASHGEYINCIQWIRSENQDKSFLLSTSSNGSGILWSLQSDELSLPNSINCCLKTVTTLKSHEGSASCGYGVFLPSHRGEVGNDIFAVTTGDDFLIKGWRINASSGENEEVFNYKLPGRSLALDLLIIPSPDSSLGRHWPLILYGGDTGKVHIMSSKDGRSYEPIFALSGHHDWITSLTFCVEENEDIILSSGSKDGVIRLWRLSQKPKKKDDGELLQVKDIELNLPLMDESGSVCISCSLESVLHGHDGLVSHLDWDQRQGEPLRLLSCSKTEDRSVVIWQVQTEDGVGTEDGIWIEKVRLGEVGGNREGFFNAKFGPHGDEVVATSYQGGFHLWRNEDENTWSPQPVVSGHFSEVVDLDWEEGGRYLLTVGKDQTTRLHSCLSRGSGEVVWQEIARPQVHGYDMACVAALDGFRFASASEEKVVRGFTPTKAFVRRLKALSPSCIDVDEENLQLPEIASVPSLGLSNKAEDQPSICNVEEDAKTKAKIAAPPTEDELMLGTLWPEISKLYGHGNELLALTASHDRSLLASSCKAANELDARIILWNTKEWKEEFSLNHHRLSVTQLEFSSCDTFLLSVSRDRSWAVFRRDALNGFALHSHSETLDKKSQHSRIIWSCGWVPHSKKFITGSRDKSVVVWDPVFHSEDCVTSWVRGATFTEKEEVTAIAVTKGANENDSEDFKWLLAVGYVTGSIMVRVLNGSRNEVLDSCEIEPSHRKSVRRLKFRPLRDRLAPPTLASCGNDNAVFLHEIHL